MDPIGPEHRDFVTSLGKGLAVIKAFGPGAGHMTLSQVAAETALNRAGARRILLTLESLGYVTRDGNRFSLTSRILDLGFSYLSAADWWQVAMPHMEWVARSINQSCSAAVLQDTEIVYVARVPANRVMSVSLNLGARLPAYCTSMGRVLLAGLAEGEAWSVLDRSERRSPTAKTVVEMDALMRELDAVRRQGFCFVDQELEAGLRSISVPITTSSNRTLAALNVSAHASGTSVSVMTTDYLGTLREAAAQIRRRLP